MRRVQALGLAAAFAGGIIVVVAACSSDPGSSYGNPNTLARNNLPGGGEAGIEAVSCGDAGIGGDGGGAGGCAVSFATDIYPQMKTDGNWKCAKSGCHAAGGTQPTIDETSAQNAYQSLTNAQPIGTTPYLNTKSKDPAQSGFYCNCGTRTCGSPMPKDTTGVKQLNTTEICKLQAWIACGAPNN